MGSQLNKHPLFQISYWVHTHIESTEQVRKIPTKNIRENKRKGRIYQSELTKEKGEKTKEEATMNENSEHSRKRLCVCWRQKVEEKFASLYNWWGLNADAKFQGNFFVIFTCSEYWLFVFYIHLFIFDYDYSIFNFIKESWRKMK